MVNILYIAHESGKDFNGASRSLLSLIDSFSNSNNRIFVLIPHNYGRLYEELNKRNCILWTEKYKRWIIPRSRHNYIWLWERIKWGLFYNAKNDLLCRKLVKQIKENDINIIHSNSSVIDIGARIHFLTNIPHVWHFREFAQEDFNMWPVVDRKKYLKLLRTGSNRIITVSEAIERKYRKLLPNNSITTIYNGISVMKLKNKLVNKSDFNMLIAGTISDAKGQKNAVNATIKLINEGYKNLHLFIAGDGNLNYIAPQFVNYKSNIHNLGVIDDLDSLREKIDLELVCSKSEAFGRVTIEAMMSSIPVVGANTGGTIELIHDGFNGFLFQQGDESDLVDKIRMFLGNRNLANRLGNNAREFVLKNFTIDITVKKIENIYHELTS